MMSAKSDYCEIWANLGGLPTTIEQDMACIFLESKGLRFCIDYGYQNAIDIAQQYPEWTGQGRGGCN